MKCGYCFNPIILYYVKVGENYYHQECYEKIALRCSICKEIINGSYYETKHGHVCEKCYDPKICCFSCGRQLQQNTMLRLGDCRVICANCNLTTVYQIENEHLDIIKKFFALFGCSVKRGLFIQIVDYPQLCKLSTQKVRGTRLGICKTIFCKGGNFKTVTKHDIFILYGLPLGQYLGTLAHEMFHAWLNENVRYNSRISDDDMEWLCESIASEVLRNYITDQFWCNYFRESRENYQATTSLKNRLEFSHGSQIVSYVKMLA